MGIASLRNWVPLVAALWTATFHADSAGFAAVVAPRTFSFPADHGAHRDYRHEWWYVTGNLDDPKGRRFGFQITFFRFGLASQPSPRSSRWAASEIYMAHFALTDEANRRFHSFERRARGALGLAGAQTGPLRIWLEDWELKAEAGDDFPWQIHAHEGSHALHLVLRNTRPLVLQGEEGLSQKSAERGNASYYYSATRLKAEGSLEVEGRSIPVGGLAWLDREWSSSALAPYQAGWDWFSLQLDEGTDLMYYQLRLKAGGSDVHSAGSFILPDGRKTPLRPEDVRLTAIDYWRAPDGVVYPVSWRMQITSIGKDLLIRPIVADQEWRGGSFRYWEGAVDVFDPQQPAVAIGRGYLEMTGYAAPFLDGEKSPGQQMP